MNSLTHWNLPNRRRSPGTWREHLLKCQKSWKILELDMHFKFAFFVLIRHISIKVWIQIHKLFDSNPNAVYLFYILIVIEGLEIRSNRTLHQTKSTAPVTQNIIT